MKCNLKTLGLGILYQRKRLYDLDPPYQRESGIWSIEKKQFFMDSLLKEYDIPKIYVHEISEFDLPVVDGKQRLTTIWSFMNNEFPLNQDFEYIEDLARKNSLDYKPEGGYFYEDFHDSIKEVFKNIPLDIVYISDAEEDDIDDLFSRLNNGEPLNSAEKRNAIGGKMAALTREIATHNFFTQSVSFKNKRFAHREVAVKFLQLEKTDLDSNSHILLSELTKKYLDELVSKNKKIEGSDYASLEGRVKSNLDTMSKVFDNSDSLISKQTYPQIFYVFIKTVMKNYSFKNGKDEKLIREFLRKFEEKRILNRNLEEGERDEEFVEYGLCAMQGTNNFSGMNTRINLLLRYFVEWNISDINIRDKKRRFTGYEREYIWIRDKKKCTECGEGLSLNEMDADHIQPWTEGGPTILENARSLCQACNRSGRYNRT